MIDDNDVDVLWVMGAIRKINMQNDIAIYCFNKIIKLGVARIVNGHRNISVMYAREMINDSKFELYRIYRGQNPSLAKRYLIAIKEA